MDKKKGNKYYKKNKNKNADNNENQNNNKNNDEKEDDEYDILESVGLKSTFYNDQIQRYFSKYYLNKGEPNEQYIFIHSNGIILCGIGKNNDILKKNITEINILKQPTNITGRNKHGAHFLAINEYIIKIKYDDQFVNFSPKVKGKLLEVNENIVKNPKLLIESPEKNGFICLIQKEPNELEKFRKELGQPDNFIINIK